MELHLQTILKATIIEITVKIHLISQVQVAKGKKKKINSLKSWLRIFVKD